MHGLNGTDALKPERNCDIMSIIFHIIPEKLLTSVWIVLVFSCTAVYNEHFFTFVVLTCMMYLVFLNLVLTF